MDSFSTVIVRDATLDDVDALTWENATHAGHVGDEIKRRDATGGIGEGEVDMIVVEVPGADGQRVVAGKSAIDWTARDDAGRVWMLSVSPDHRRMGLAQALMAEIEQRTAARGRTHVDLAVEKDNEPAIRLYEKLGYVKYTEGTDSWPAETPDGTVVTYHAKINYMQRRLDGTDADPV